MINLIKNLLNGLFKFKLFYILFYNIYTMARSKIEKCQERNKVSGEMMQK